MAQLQDTLIKHKRMQVQGLPADEDKSVLEARSRTFIKWINSILHREGIHAHVNNLDSDLESGVVLINLLEILAHKKWTLGRLVVC